MAYGVEHYQTDVLIIGGGIAGAIAAIQAREKGAEVIVLEAANTYRSGNAGSGIDHMYSYVPPIHERVGYTKEDMKHDIEQTAMFSLGIGTNHELIDLFVEKSYERVLTLEKYGLNFRFEGGHLAEGFRLVPQFHSIPTSFNFDGRDIKVKLTDAMLEAGVKIINHAEVVKLLRGKDGSAAGAVAVSTREEKLIVVNSKTSILSTYAGVGRLAEKSNTNYDYLERPSVTESGYGLTLPLHLGAEVVNLEFEFKQGGLTFLGFDFTAGAPGGSWWPATRVVDDEGNVVVERIIDYDINEPDYVKKNTEQFAKYHKQKAQMIKIMKQGKQLYVDLEDASDEEVEYIKWTLSNEGKCWLFVQNINQENIDLKKVKIPFKLVPGVGFHGTGSGVLVDGKCESTVRNLYAAGNVIGGAAMVEAPEALVFGFEAGEQAAIRVKEIETYPEFDAKQVDEVKAKAENILYSETGESWKVILKELQGIVGLFGTSPHTDVKLNHGLDLIRDTKEKTIFQAKNPHELTRVFEVLSLLDAAEAIFTAATIRKENLGPFKKHLDEDKTIYAETFAAEDGKIPSVEIYGLYYDENDKLQYHTHVTNQNI